MSGLTQALLFPDWPAPARVQAASTTRWGGVSAPPYDSLNLAGHVGDNPACVAENRRRLAAKLGLPFIDAIEKVVDNPPQKMQQNRFHQCQNLDGAFVITPPLMPGPALLVDDIVDSAWTLTVLTALLRQAGCPTVYPLALASTSVKN